MQLWKIRWIGKLLAFMNYLSLNFHLFRRENWSGWQKFVWVIQLFGSNFLIVLGIYSKLHKLIRPSPRSSLVGGQAALIFVWLSGRLQFRAPPLSFKISISPSYLLKHSIDSSAYASSFCQSSQYNTSPCFWMVKYFLFKGSFTYVMITNAWNEKAEAEEEMRLKWLEENGNVRNYWGNKERVHKNYIEKNSRKFEFCFLLMV